MSTLPDWQKRHPAIRSLMRSRGIKSIAELAEKCGLELDHARIICSIYSADLDMSVFSVFAARNCLTIDQLANLPESEFRKLKGRIMGSCDLKDWKAIAKGLHIGLDELRFVVLRYSDA